MPTVFEFNPSYIRSQMASDRRSLTTNGDRIGLLLLFTFLLVLYLYTSPPGVALEDDGLFVMGSYHFGVVHPPGYPLYTLIGKMATLIPVGSIAYRVHGVSALFAALTCILLWLVTRSLVPGRFPAYAAAFALGFSQVFWSQAIVAEVYTLNTFFLFLLVWLILRLSSVAPEQAHANLLLIGFLYGLSLANHWPLILLSTPGLLALFWPYRRNAIRHLLSVLAAVALGLTPYLLLFLRSRSDTDINFYGPIESWQEFWYFVSRQGYSEVDQSSSAGLLDQLQYGSFLFEQLLTQFAWLGAVLALVGFVSQWRVWRYSVCVGLMLGFLGNSLLLPLLLGFDYGPLFQAVIRVYPLTAYGIMAVWLALGLYAVARFTGRHAGVTGGAAVVLLSAALLLVNLPQNNRHGDRWAEDYAQAVLQTLDKDAILFVHGDFSLPIAYKRLVEGVRPDIEIYSRQGLIFNNRLFDARRVKKAEAETLLRQFSLSSERPVYSTDRLYGKQNFLQQQWIVNRIYPANADRLPSVVLSKEAASYAQHIVLQGAQLDPWSERLRSTLLYRLGYLLEFGRMFPGSVELDSGAIRLSAQLENQFYPRMGMLKARMAFRDRQPRDLEADFKWLEQRLQGSVREKRLLAEFFTLKGDWARSGGNTDTALDSYARALADWASRHNQALIPMLDIYAESGNLEAVEELVDRFYPAGNPPARVRRLKQKAVKKAKHDAPGDSP